MGLGLTAWGKGHLLLRRGESIPCSLLARALESVGPRRVESVDGRP